MFVYVVVELIHRPRRVFFDSFVLGIFFLKILDEKQKKTTFLLLLFFNSLVQRSKMQTRMNNNNKNLIGQMSDEIDVVVVKFVHGKTQVAVVKESEKWFGVRDEHVASNVEFAFVDEQRIVNVLLNDASERLAYAEATLLAVFGELEFLFERLGTTHQVDSFALIQRHRFANPQLVFYARFQFQFRQSYCFFRDHFRFVSVCFTFSCLKEGLFFDLIVQLERERHVLFEWHENGQFVGRLQLKLLERLQAAQQIELVGE